MNALALPAALPLPDMSRELSYLCKRRPMRVPSRDGGTMLLQWTPTAATPEQVAEAKALVPRYEAAAVPSEQAATAWLMALNAAVANPQSEAAFRTRLSALMVILGEYPGVIFTQETLKIAMRMFEFFPSGAKLADLLDYHAEDFRDRLDGLRLVIAENA